MRELPRAALALLCRSQHHRSFPADFVAAVVCGGGHWSQRYGSVAALISHRRTLSLAACFLAILSASQWPSSATAEDATAALGSPLSNHLPVDLDAAFVTEASRRFAIPERWIRAIIAVESAGNAQAVSPRGALGLMQIMPQTWVTLSVRYDLGLDPFDPRDNILAGTAYPREMLDRFGSEGFLAAYNAGPRRYDDHLATGRPLPGETQIYVARIESLIGIEQCDGDTPFVRRAVRSQEAALLVEQQGSSLYQFYIRVS